MSLVMPAVAAAAFVILFFPWLAVVLSPLLVLAIAAGTVVAGLGARRLEAQPAASRLLAVEGLAAEPALENALRAAIGRVLAFAPAATRAKACACVKPVEGGFVGVLRVFDRDGHHLERAYAPTRAEVVRTLVAVLDVDRYPVVAGTRRQRCIECVPASCPLRLMARGLALEAAAA